MPRTTPSQSRIENVIAALKANDLTVRSVVVSKDGGFTVSVDETQENAAASPPKWGQVG